MAFLCVLVCLGSLASLGQGSCFPWARGSACLRGWVGAFPNALCCPRCHTCLCVCLCEVLVCLCLVKMYDFECGWVIFLVLQLLQIARAVLCLADLRPGPGVHPGAVVCGCLCCMLGPGVVCGSIGTDVCAGSWFLIGFKINYFCIVFGVFFSLSLLSMACLVVVCMSCCLAVIGSLFR